MQYIVCTDMGLTVLSSVWEDKLMYLPKVFAAERVPEVGIEHLPQCKHLITRSNSLPLIYRAWLEVNVFHEIKPTHV